MADEKILRIFKESKNIAVVGCSRDSEKPSNYVPRYLQSNGYTIIPINPSATKILGEKAYKSLLDVDKKIDVVEVFRPGEEALEIVRQAVQKKAKAVWLQEGITNNEAKEYAEAHGLVFIQNLCMMKENFALKYAGKL